jgi:glycosyltransferase involved in cell wall biosynthesis
MLVFGKQYTKNNINKIGGVIKLFELFKEELSFNKVEYEVVDLNWRNYKNPVFAYIYIYYSALFKIKNHSSISFHGTANEFIYIAPVVVFSGKLLNKKLSLRKFAGNFDFIFSKLNFIQKFLVEFSLKRSDSVFWETHHLVSFFKSYNPQTFWFPNVRPPQSKKRKGKYKNKFVFIGQVKETKGVYQVLEAFKKLDINYSVDFYGPIEASNFKTMCNAQNNVNYRGVLAPEEVATTLKNYDVLLLPSFHPGEGYPGVIIEAFSCGLPVITTDWGGIPEIVKNGVDGFIIEPKNVQELVEAIHMINISTYEALAINAVNSFDNFDSRKVTQKIIQLI